MDGLNFNNLALEDRAMQGLALVLERREVFGSMSVEESVVLGGNRPRSLGVKDWRSTLDVTYGLFPRLKERRRQIAETR